MNLEEDLKNFESARHKVTQVFQLHERFGLEFEPKQCFEFFFYAENEDDASNLAIDLFQLKYKMERVDKSIDEKWCVNGWTKEMPSDLDAISQWTEKMEKLAEKHHSNFDGWGSFCK